MMLGVQRSGVSCGSGRLAACGPHQLPPRRRHHPRPPGLKKRSCECYGVSKREFDRLLQSTTRQARPREQAPAMLMPARITKRAK